MTLVKQRRNAQQQLSLSGFGDATAVFHDAAAPRNADERGAIFTRRVVVDFILDLVGYTADIDLHEASLLEPSFGDGDFLLPAIERLLAARLRAQQSGVQIGSIDHCIQAVELHADSYMLTRDKVVALLIRSHFPLDEAQRIARVWLVQGDYLLADIPSEFDFIVGNPPYVRQELIPAPLLEEYRRRYTTLYDRADLYVPFIERSLHLLKDRGQLSFICSDRWMKNKYGGPLRDLVSQQFHLGAYIDMVDADAFHSEVSAYPAITVISRNRPGPTRVADRPQLDHDYLRTLALAFHSPVLADTLIREITGIVSGSSPWILDLSAKTLLIKRLEADYPILEEVGCKVGIGVATGADKAFIGQFSELDVEEDRKLPLAMAKDLASGHVVWRGYGVINPFTDEGPLVDLAKYPKLRRYLEGHRQQIMGRHVAKKNPENWYRTIDRITPSLSSRPKLLIPDIRGEAQVAFESGNLYPHHNLYFIVSDTWDLRALQAVLLSSITRLFISTYSTKMRGGYLRFQAQYLRRIRLPIWDSISPAMRERLINAASALDIDECNEATADLYSLTQQERHALAH
ncbi:Eco57I restriction-modification methylase domain-containing protein [Janthinobacterium sp. J1-1]|uniref:Eco57I restriction-modification methylase domain-containing protein n=1 Tax=Janthinobacterium sp. J1-1 TaxID=3065910 RepID=UPI002810A59A|nr:Eco57I restriction-modification methylase domain-containing protein [Janthinobacterium sp. J1-1]